MTRVELYENFAENIERERIRLKLSQKKMADSLQISLSKYKILITNPYEANIDIYLAHHIQKITGKSVRELCEDDLPELEMIRNFRNLSSGAQEIISYMIEKETCLDNIPSGGIKCVRKDTPVGYVGGRLERQSNMSDISNITKDETEMCPCCSGKSKQRDEKEYKDLINRLKRIEGQVRGVAGMLENDAYCTDILMQVSAITSALNSFNKALLANHIKTCVADNVRAGNDDVIDELVGTIQKLMK